MTSISKNYKVKLSFSLSPPYSKSKIITDAVYHALEPDIRLLPSNADTSAVISRTRSKLSLEILATTVQILRANINSYLRLANSSYQSIVEE